jgi:hypothetical protein
VKETRTLRELFSFPGFYAERQLAGVFGDPKARIVELKRQKKERHVQDAAGTIAVITIPRLNKCEILTHWDGEYISALNRGESNVLAVEE